MGFPWCWSRPDFFGGCTPNSWNMLKPFTHHPLSFVGFRFVGFQKPVVNVPFLGDWFHITKTNIFVGMDIPSISRWVSAWVMWNIGRDINLPSLYSWVQLGWCETSGGTSIYQAPQVTKILPLWIQSTSSVLIWVSRFCLEGGWFLWCPNEEVQDMIPGPVVCSNSWGGCITSWKRQTNTYTNTIYIYSIHKRR